MYRNIAVKSTLFGLTLGLFSSLCAYAQTAVDGAIGGTVEDTSNAVVPNATIVVHNNGTNAEQTVVADASGYFRALHLTSGHYTVTITAPGFGTFKSNDVSVQVGLLTDLQAKMSVGGDATTVEVSGEAPAINTTAPDFSGVVNQNVLENVPVNNYRWSAYALQTPGVVESGGYGLLSVRGQSTLLNNVTVDGMDDNQAFFSEERGRTTVGYSTAKGAIEEFQVNTSNYSTEYGRATGGVVNAVTKSGTNQFHGEGYYLDRDSQWAAFNPYTKESVQQTPGGPFVSEPFKPTDLRRQYGFGIGGPIIKDKLFFYFAADRYFHDFPAVGVASAPGTFFTSPSAALPSNVTCSNINATPGNAGYDPNFTADNGACALMNNAHFGSYSAAVTAYNNGLAGLNSMLGQAPRYAGQTIFFPKVDWQINGKNHATFEANRLRFTSPSGQQTNSTANYGLASFGNIYVRDTWGIAKLDTVVTNNITNEIRYQYGRDDNYAFNQPADSYENSSLLMPPGYTNPMGIPPYVSIQNGFGFGTPTFLNRPAYPDERRWQVADTVTHVHGNHTFKYGGDFIHTYDLSENLVNVFGDFVYNQTSDAQGAVSGLSNYLSDYYLSQNAATAGQAAHYTSYTQGFGKLGFQFATEDYSGFVEDQWKFSPRLSLTFGLRYDYEQTPTVQLPNPAVPQTETLPDGHHEIGPRVGFAYDVFGSGKTVLRGGYGMVYGRLINSTIYNALAQTGVAGGQTQVGPLTPGQTGAPTFPQVMSATVGSSTPPTVDYFASNFKNPEVHEADLTVEQDIGWNTVFSMSWLGSFGRDLPDFVDSNLPAPTSINYTVVNTNGQGVLHNGAVITTPFYGYASGTGAPAVADYGRPNPNYGVMDKIFSGVTSNYEALVLQVQHRMSHHLQFQGNYTWSHALDYGATNTTFTPSTGMSMLDPRNIRADYGNALENVPNRFVFTAVATAPWHYTGVKGNLLNDFELSPSFAAQNGNPYSAGLSGSSANLVSSYSPTGYVTGTQSGNGSFNGSDGAVRIPGLERDAFKQPATYMFDARISKRITIHEGYQLELLAEGFNLFNHQNVTSMNMTAYSLGTAKTSAGQAYNTLTEYTSATFGTANNSNNNNIYTPRELQLGARLQF
jgi:outer membrane receptor protein involved in Fe transport